MIDKEILPPFAFAAKEIIAYPPAFYGVLTATLIQYDDATWADIVAFANEPCGKFGCDCHEKSGAFYSGALNTLREEGKQLSPDFKPSPSNG